MSNFTCCCCTHILSRADMASVGHLLGYSNNESLRDGQLIPNKC